MKTKSVLSLLSVLALVFVCYMLVNGAISFSKKENITFYEVPLVCSAYTEIGCGSRAKPALIDMEKNDAIKEAWLNREGTVIAIVWENEPQTENVAEPIFKKYEIDFTELNGKDARKNSNTFRAKQRWYQGTEVDKLSIEEASHVAQTYSDFSVSKKMITLEESNKIKTAIENYFKTELVKTRTPQQLYEDDENKFKSDVVNIFISHIGTERTEKLIGMYMEFEQEQCAKECAEDAKQCCKKK